MDAEPQVQSPTVLASSRPTVANVATSFEGPVGVKNSPLFLPASDANSPMRIMYAVPSTSNCESASLKSISLIFTMTFAMSDVLAATVSPKSGSCSFMSLNNPENAASDACPMVEPISSFTARS